MPEPPPLTRYFVEFGPDHVLLSKQEGEMFANGIQVKPMKFNPGEWYYVEVLGQGPRVMVTVNKETALDFPDGKPLLEGGISFETLEQSAVCVDDVEVNELTSPLPPPAEMPGAPAGGGDPMAMIGEASKLLDAKEIDKGLAVLDEAVALEAQNPKVLLAAGDAALSHGARFAQRALMRFYLPGLQLAREQKMEVVGRLSAQTTLAMYAMAQDPDGEKVFNELIQVMQPPDWPAAGKIRWQVFSPGADLGALEKELADLTAKFSDNQALYLVRGDLNVRQKRLVRAGQDYNTVMKNWTKDTPGWVLAEAQCKFKAIQENRLNANLEITCVDLSSLVTGK
jgi:hypothetical protein